MDINQLVTMIQQYEQQGKDISTLLNDYTSLAAAGKTPLGLNQWVHSDKPRMEDFNEDNRIIDGALLSLEANKANITDLYTKTQIDEQMANKVNKGTPNKYNLPLLSGYKVPTNFTYESVYYKSDDNLVSVEFSVQTVDGSPFGTGWREIAYLPVGFQPDALKHGSGFLPGPSWQYVGAYVDLNGGLWIGSNNATLNIAHGFICYYVA